ncbi:MAG: exosortase/archaeosortase family protein [Candidatus Omnitrophota bacterium]
MNNYLKILIITVLLAGVYFHTFTWMVDRWNAEGSYYSHGFLIPLVSIYLIWLKRNRLAGTEIAAFKPGIVFVVFGLLLHIISTVIEIYFTSGFSFLFVLTGIILFIWGREVFRVIWVPVNFLLFMLPLPLVLIANISLKMKLFAAGVAAFVLTHIGITAKSIGSIIYMQNSQLEVGDPCSGLRSLISLLALGVLFAYFSRISRPKKYFLVMISVPLALVSNIIRILFLAFVSDVYGTQYIHGFVHDAAGFMVFVVAFIGLMFVNNFLSGAKSESAD